MGTKVIEGKAYLAVPNLSQKDNITECYMLEKRGGEKRKHAFLAIEFQRELRK